MVEGTPIVNFELTPAPPPAPIIKILNEWFTVGGTPIKISNLGD